MLENLNVDVLSNLIVVNNKYNCSRLSIIFTPKHEHFCNLAIPDQTFNFNFNTCDDITENKGPVITLNNSYKYSLKRVNKNHIDVTNIYKDNSKNKTYNLKIGTSMEVNNLIWLITRRHKEYEIRVYKEKSNFLIINFFRRSWI